ncbi:MAG: hypothetical protein ABIH08_01640 [Candidatus Omnitrophota bacterium]
MRIFVIAFIFSILFNMPARAEENNFKQLRSEHFFINYHPDVGQSYIYKVKNKAEGFYKTITHEFSFTRDEFWLWENRARIFVAKDKQNYLDSFNCSSWSGACVHYQDKIIYTYPDQEKFIPILAHELTHIIFREYMGKGYFPLWLDEGVATYIEDKQAGGLYKKNLFYLEQKIKDNSYIKLEKLNQITPGGLNGESKDFVNLFYLEAFSLVNFFKKQYGEYSFSRFLYYLKKGSSVVEAFSKISYYLQSFDDLEEKWKTFYWE